MIALTDARSELVIATHSPIVLAYPDAAIHECDDDGLRAIDYDEAEPVTLVTGFRRTAGDI